MLKIVPLALDSRFRGNDGINVPALVCQASLAHAEATLTSAS